MVVGYHYFRKHPCMELMALVWYGMVRNDLVFAPVHAGLSHKSHGFMMKKNCPNCRISAQQFGMLHLQCLFPFRMIFFLEVLPSPETNIAPETLFLEDGFPFVIASW